MKKVLIITYYFPPSGGPGVQRVLKFIKYLSRFGWEPVIFTVENGQFLGYDESLFKDIPDNTKIYKSRTIEPYTVYNKLTGNKESSGNVDVNIAELDTAKMNFKQKLIHFVRSTFFIPDARIGWLFKSKKTLKKIMKEHRIDAVYSSSPPYTASLLGRYVRRKFNIPWIADFRDPWTGYKGTPERWAIPEMIEKMLERSVFMDSDAVSVAWEGIIDDAVKKFPKPDREKFFEILNGFDPEDIPNAQNTKNEKFTVTYTGSLYTIQNPENLFNAVKQLSDEGKVDTNRIKFQFIGRIADEVRDTIKNSTLSDTIEILPYMPHSDIMRKLSESDCTLLIGVNSSEKFVNVPGKTFEYIGVRKPILTIAPENSKLADVVRSSGISDVADHDDINKMKNIFLKFYNAWENNSQPFKIDDKKIMQHSRVEGTKKLAEKLDEIGV